MLFWIAVGTLTMKVSLAPVPFSSNALPEMDMELPPPNVELPRIAVLIARPAIVSESPPGVALEEGVEDGSPTKGIGTGHIEKDRVGAVPGD